jgi:hypothetical protein
MVTLLAVSNPIEKTFIRSICQENMDMLSEQLDQGSQQHIDYVLLRRILAPYSHVGTDYLKSLQLLHTWRFPCLSEDESLITACGEFRIPSSCYIKDTGHFNAVEFLICYNQLAYSTFGHLFDGEYFNDSGFMKISPGASQALARISIDAFFKNQLSSMLILKTSTRFKGLIDAKYFTGTLSINKIKNRSNTLFAETTCVFRDNNGGYADGEVLLAYQPKLDQ